RARLTSDAVKNARANTKSGPTPYSCAMLKYAHTNAMTTSTDVVIAANVANNMDLFNNTARRLSRGVSSFKWALETSSSPIAFNVCDRSIMRFIRAINTEVNEATAPNKNAGAVTCVITRDNCVTVGVAKTIEVLNGRTMLPGVGDCQGLKAECPTEAALGRPQRLSY